MSRRIKMRKTRTMRKRRKKMLQLVRSRRSPKDYTTVSLEALRPYCSCHRGSYKKPGEFPLFLGMF